jgi:transposase
MQENNAMPDRLNVLQRIRYSIFPGTLQRPAYRKRLKYLKIELIAPHRSNRKKPKTQDGRKLRRYRKRWKVERTFAWIGNFRRLVVRYERDIKMYRAFFHLACLMITLNRF